MAKSEQPMQAVQAVGYQGKSRNVLAGFNFFGQALPFINFIMFLLGWFTVPVEVLFRKNFGQRWLTGINFYAGLLVLVIFNVLQTLSSVFGSNTRTYSYGRYGQQQQVPDEPSLWDSFMNHSMFFILLAYILVGSYHFFKMWWGNRTNSAQHSFADGTSRFEPIAVYLMRLVNIIAVPVIRIYILLLPKEEQKRTNEIPPLTNEVTAFTNTIFEPLVLVILFFIFKGTTSTWLLISAAALTVYANWKEAAKLDRALDFRDIVIEAEDKIADRVAPQETSTSTLENLIMQQAANAIETKPEVAAQVKQQYPDLMSIIDEMNS